MLITMYICDSYDNMNNTAAQLVARKWNVIYRTGSEDASEDAEDSYMPLIKVSGANDAQENMHINPLDTKGKFLLFVSK